MVESFALIQRSSLKFQSADARFPVCIYSVNGLNTFTLVKAKHHIIPRDVESFDIMFRLFVRSRYSPFSPTHMTRVRNVVASSSIHAAGYMDTILAHGNVFTTQTSKTKRFSFEEDRWRWYLHSQNHIRYQTKLLLFTHTFYYDDQIVVRRGFCPFALITRRVRHIRRDVTNNILTWILAIRHIHVNAKPVLYWTSITRI